MGGFGLVFIEATAVLPRARYHARRHGPVVRRAHRAIQAHRRLSARARGPRAGIGSSRMPGARPACSGRGSATPCSDPPITRAATIRGRSSFRSRCSGYVEGWPLLRSAHQGWSCSHRRRLRRGGCARTRRWSRRRSDLDWRARRSRALVPVPPRIEHAEGRIRRRSGGPACASRSRSPAPCAWSWPEDKPLFFRTSTVDGIAGRLVARRYRHRSRRSSSPLAWT